MLRAVNYMHKIHLCHRDLKPENFIFVNKEALEKSSIKLIDFGASSRFEEGQFLKTRIGSPNYVAPEVCRGKYSNEVDIWSCGVIMFIMLSGSPPFDGETTKEILEKVKK